MFRTKRIVEAAFIYRATDQAKFAVAETIRNAQKLQEDSDRAKRHAKAECLACFYLWGRIGGAAITTTQCGRCETEITFGNTCVDVLCLECAKRLGLCVHCGGDMELKHRRKRTL
jgi:hypothetical protein